MRASDNIITSKRRHPRLPSLAALLCAVIGLLVSGAALAAGYGHVVSAATNQKLGKTVVVEAHGRTLYALSPESTHHLLCRSTTCLQNWPPLTVKSAKLKLAAGAGVQGRLGLLRRSGGKWQVTLRGMPLYRFAGDTAKGQTNGEGLMSFGGTWHAVTSAAHPTANPIGEAKPPTTPSPAPEPSPAPYKY